MNKQGLKGGHTIFEKYLGGPQHAQVASHKSRDFSCELYTCTVRGFELVTSSLTRSFLTISPTQHI
jgi:hypothetical protein